MTRDRRRRRARDLGLALSAAVHLLLLAALGWRAAPRLAVPEVAFRPDVQLTMVRPLPAPATSRPAQASSAAGAPPLQTPSTPGPSPVPAPAKPTSIPSAPTAAAPAPGAAAAGAGVHPGPLPGAESGGDLKGFLRAGVGCAHRDGVGLTRAEREVCDQKAGEVAKAAPKIDKIPAEKRAYYDAVAAANAAMRYETPVVRPPVTGTGAAAGLADPPTAMPGRRIGLACSPFLLLKGASKNLPPHSLKLGPCAVIPPIGPLNPDNDVPPPASLREREADAKHLRDLDPPPSTDGR